MGQFNGLDLKGAARSKNNDETYAPWSDRPGDTNIRQYDPLVCIRAPVGQSVLFGNEPYPLVVSSVCGLKRKTDKVFYGYATNPGPNNGSGGHGEITDNGVSIMQGTAQWNNVTPRTMPCLTDMRLSFTPFAVRGDNDEILCGIEYPNDCRPPTRLVPQHIPIDAPHVNHDLNVTARAVHWVVSDWLQHGVALVARQVLSKVDDYLKRRLVEEDNPLEMFALIEAAILLLDFNHCFYYQNIEAFAQNGVVSAAPLRGGAITAGGGGAADPASAALQNVVEATKLASVILNKAREQDQLAIDKFHRYIKSFDEVAMADHPMNKINTNINAAHFPYCDQNVGSETFIADTATNPFSNQAFASRTFNLKNVLHIASTRQITGYNEFNNSLFCGTNIYECGAGDSGTVVL